MKIVHLCLSCFYIDGYAYQENQLVAQHVADGHEVTVIASTESFDANKRPCNVEPANYPGTDGAQVIRLPYRRIGPNSLAAKIRAYPGVKSMLERLSPDVILFHGLCAWEMLTVARYAKNHPNVLLYADCHEDFNNSARTPLSKWGLHFCFYRPIVRHCLPALRKVLCVTVESVAFARDFYGVDAALLELYPLGGQVLDNAEYATTRAAARVQLAVTDSDIVFVQSGKLDATKQLTNALRAFASVRDSRLRFVIAGHMAPDVQSEAQPLIETDARVRHLGWIEPDALRRLLCAADVYVQPFGQTATTQMSLCCRCAIIVQDLPSHRALFCNNGFLTTEQQGLTTAFRHISDHADTLNVMQHASGVFAQRHLDYRVLARRVCN